VLVIVVFPSALPYRLGNGPLTVLLAGAAGVLLNLITVFTATPTILTGHACTLSRLIGGAVVIGGVIITDAPSFHRRTTSQEQAAAQLELEIARERVTDSVAERRATGKDLGGLRRTLTDAQIRTLLRRVGGSARSGQTGAGRLL
jgi:hypothetical protein